MPWIARLCWVSIAMGLGACTRVSDTFPCSSSTACVRDGEIGVCEIDTGFCSFDDASCTVAGRRYAPSAGDGVAGACVCEDGAAGSAPSPIAHVDSCHAYFTGTDVEISQDTTIDTTTLSIDPHPNGAFKFDASAQAGSGPELAMLHAGAFTLAGNVTVRVVGNRPLVLVASGDVTIGGLIDAGARAEVPGPGGSLPGAGPGVGAGNPSSVEDMFGLHVPGGGGGGFKDPGGSGGDARSGATGGATGAAGGIGYGDAQITVLQGGSGGGQGNGNGCPPTPGGAGGGSIQITSLTRIAIASAQAGISVGGGGGAGGQSCATAGGSGSGGGSGGSVLLQAPMVDNSGVVAANGGGGGGGAGAVLVGQPGSVGRDGAATLQAAIGGSPGDSGEGSSGGNGGTASLAPAAVGTATSNAGGGGGAAGWVRLLSM